MKKNQKIAAGGVALLLALGLGVAAVGSTSAYFSDTNTGGAVVADLGSIQVSVNGSDTSAATLTFDNLLPGQATTQEFTVKNTGENTQDVWIQFPSKTQLAMINSLGTYATLEISVEGETVFYSANLNDSNPNDPTLVPLPSQVLLAEGLAPGQEATVQFELTINPNATDQQLEIPAITVLNYNVVATQPGINPGA